jgi:RNA polymerase sigma-70 factor, ECF subfamily
MIMNLNEIETDDTLLIKEFLNGNEASYTKLALKYQKKVYWHARRMMGNHLDADEIVQEVLLIMYTKLDKFQFRSSLYTWIYRITATRCINLLRKRKVKEFLSLDDGIEERRGEDIIENIEQKEKLKMVEDALQLLPPKQREVFILRAFEELSYEEIAEVTKKSIGGLKANYFHAIKKIEQIVNNGEMIKGKKYGK